MSAQLLHASGSSVVGRLAVTRGKHTAIAFSEGLRLGSQAAVPVRTRKHLGTGQNSSGTARVAEVVGPSGDGRATEERFLDVQAFLSDFNPLKQSHLLVWEGSDDEDGAVQVELPQAAAWEDSASGYQGLEYQPSWIDYRDGSESDDSNPRRNVLGAYEAMAAVLPDLKDDPSAVVHGTSPLQGGGLAGAEVPSAYSPEAGFQEISVVELEERLATGQFSLLLDVRTREEYDSGHIASAVNLPLQADLSTAVRSGSLDEFRDRPVAVVCASGGRSGQATVRLTKVFGFSNVMNVTGGMQAWEREGMPVQGPMRSGGPCGCGGGGGSGGGCKNKQAA